jgi:predicted nuclease of predicted toxin-antitoxin system
MPWINVHEHPDAALSKEDKAALAKLAKISPKKKQKKMRFYVDADVPPQAVKVLIEMGYDVLTPQESGKKTHEDEDQLAIALKQERILIPHDRDYLNDRRFPLHKCPTLVVCSFGTGTTDEIFATFDCLRILELGGQVPGGQVPPMGVKIDANPSEWTEKTRYQEGSRDRHRYRIHQDKWQVWV